MATDARQHCPSEQSVHADLLQHLGVAPRIDPDDVDVLEYAATAPAPLLVLEDLRGEPRPLREVAFGGLRRARL